MTGTCRSHHRPSSLPPRLFSLHLLSNVSKTKDLPHTRLATPSTHSYHVSGRGMWAWSQVKSWLVSSPATNLPSSSVAMTTSARRDLLPQLQKLLEEVDLSPLARQKENKSSQSRDRTATPAGAQGDDGSTAGKERVDLKNDDMKQNEEWGTWNRVLDVENVAIDKAKENENVDSKSAAQKKRKSVERDEDLPQLPAVKSSAVRSVEKPPHNHRTASAMVEVDGPGSENEEDEEVERGSGNGGCVEKELKKGTALEAVGEERQESVVRGEERTPVLEGSLALSPSLHCLACRPRLKCPLITSRTFLSILTSDDSTCPYHHRLAVRLSRSTTDSGVVNNECSDHQRNGQGMWAEGGGGEGVSPDEYYGVKTHTGHVGKGKHLKTDTQLNLLHETKVL